MNRDFNAWLSGFRDSIADYGYYIDFEKVHRNVESVKIELNILNSLIGSKNIEEDFDNLLKKYPEVLKCIPLLLAVRANEIYCQDKNGGYLYQFNGLSSNSDSYKYFMRETGLFDLLENHIVNNLVDYATGVETGLDSNGRKNRGGHLMEDLVESFIQKAGFIKDINYFKEMYIHQITDKWDIDLSAISNKGKMEKTRWYKTISLFWCRRSTSQREVLPSITKVTLRLKLRLLLYPKNLFSYFLKCE